MLTKLTKFIKLIKLIKPSTSYPSQLQYAAL